jgi:hypothetical protein
MQKRKLRLQDLGELSKKNADRRAECLKSLCTLPATAKAQDIHKVVRAVYPPLLDEITIAGARALTARLRAPKPTLVDLDRARAEQRDRSQRITEATREIVHRVEVGAAAVEMLDKFYVGGKPLGDCTQRELLTEAAGKSAQAAAMQGFASWLVSLAAVIRPNETVRIADRTQVLALLRHRFENT